MRATRTGVGRLGATLAVLALALSFAGPARAASGESTPGVVVTATNPATSKGSDLMIALTARTEKSADESVSCRPQDATLRCWGSLVLRIPSVGGLSVRAFEVHRVAVGDVECGDGDDGCSGHDSLAASVAGEPVPAQVNGVAVVDRPGTSGLAAGTKVQVKLTLTDNGRSLYGDTVVVQVNEFVPGSAKPLVYRSEPQVVQQVQVHGAPDT